MEWNQLQRAIVADPPAPGTLVYLARYGEDYRWAVVDATDEEPAAEGLHGGVEAPDAWMYYSGQWPTADPDPFFADLRAELESMATGADRCRWPLDEPWPHSH